jgi:hypothetical protein
VNWPEWRRIESIMELRHNSYEFVSSLIGNLFILDSWWYWMRLYVEYIVLDDRMVGSERI